MNLSDMRTLVRRDLHDEDSSNYRWTNDELDRHIGHAAKELSECLPHEQKTDMETTPGSRELDISAVTGRVMVEAVEYPAGQYPRRFQPFSLWGDVLTILGDEMPDGSDATVYYGKIHTLDSQGSTIPVLHEDLVCGGACGYAAVEWAIYAVNRVNAGGVASPGEFLAWGKQKLDAFRRELRRLGRRNRVRVSSLYVPAFPANSKTTDYGP
ncbi:MAG: hypothetical protein MUO19_08710 [Dehalococcoidales bacterium]|nr:hypothetical protein [Dehalococcoidales bacterium]